MNDQCERFKLAELNPDNFKCLIFVQDLVSTKDAGISRRVLNELENEPKLYKTYQKCVSHIKNVRQEKVKEKNITPNTCQACGELHFYYDCPYKKKFSLEKKQKTRT